MEQYPDAATLQLLDQLCVQYVNLLEQLFTIRLNLDEALRDGHHHLALVRYLMGPGRLSCVQLPGPGATICSSIKTVSELIPDTDCYTIQLLKRNSVNPVWFRRGVDDASTAALPSQHMVDQDDAEGHSDIAGEPSIPQVREEASNPDSEPLSWFGGRVLVPNNLRKGQEAFQKATELSVELANVQVALDHVSTQFSTLIKSAVDHKWDE